MNDECICVGWSFDGPPEMDIECPFHGDPKVIEQIYGEVDNETDAAIPNIRDTDLRSTVLHGRLVQEEG